MRYGDDDRESGNIEDRRGESCGGGGGFGGGGLRIGGGIGTVVLVLVALYFGVDPSVILGGGSPAPVQPPPGPAQTRAHDDEARFVGRVLADTESVWNAQLPAQTGQAYVEPRLVLFSGATQTACGIGQAAMGPFYCPPDRKVYIDLSFYDDLRQRFRAPGDFAQAYVVAHEYGHHIQNLLGTNEQVQRAEQNDPSRANQYSVALELQADCYAGAWVADAAERGLLDSPDEINEALDAAAGLVVQDPVRRDQVLPEQPVVAAAEVRDRPPRREHDRAKVRPVPAERRRPRGCSRSRSCIGSRDRCCGRGCVWLSHIRYSVMRPRRRLA